MNKEATTARARVTREKCRQAELMGKAGASNEEVGALLGLSASVISKLKKSGYDMDVYLNMKKEENRKAAERKQQETQPEPEQITGQMEMDLKSAEPAEEKPEMSEQTKMMRFQAHLADRIIKKLDEILAEMRSIRDGGAKG